MEPGDAFDHEFCSRDGFFAPGAEQGRGGIAVSAKLAGMIGIRPFASPKRLLIFPMKSPRQDDDRPEQLLRDIC